MTLAGRLIHNFNPLGIAALDIPRTHFSLLVRLSFRALPMLMSGSFRLSGQGFCPGEGLLQHLRLAHGTQYAVIVQVSGRLHFLAVHKQRARPLTPMPVLCVSSAHFAPMLVLIRCLGSCAGYWVRAHSSSAQAARVVTHACDAAVCWECGLCPHEPTEPQHSHVQHAEEDDTCHCPGHKGESCRSLFTVQHQKRARSCTSEHGIAT